MSQILTMDDERMTSEENVNKVQEAIKRIDLLKKSQDNKLNYVPVSIWKNPDLIIKDVL